MNTRTPKQLMNSIKRVTDDITQDKQNFRIEKNLKKITDPKTGKLVKPIKPKPSPTLVAGKVQNVKDAPEELKMEQEARLKKTLRNLLKPKGEGMPRGVQPAKRGGLMKAKKKKTKKSKTAGRLAKRGYGAARK
tara:strand:+ start:767 stop:1168 length:402 start_codon:yes stop_codon:yes gene_type:complete